MLLVTIKTEGGTSHVGFICHKQPILEKNLREAITSSEFCDLRSGCTVNSLSEDENWTYCHYTNGTGSQHQVRSKFFVGADGKTGFTRKQYLEHKGIRMEKAHK